MNKQTARIIRKLNGQNFIFSGNDAELLLEAGFFLLPIFIRHKFGGAIILLKDLGGYLANNYGENNIKHVLTWHEDMIAITEGRWPVHTNRVGLVNNVEEFQ